MKDVKNEGKWRNKRRNWKKRGREPWPHNETSTKKLENSENFRKFWAKFNTVVGFPRLLIFWTRACELCNFFPLRYSLWFSNCGDQIWKFSNYKGFSKRCYFLSFRRLISWVVSPKSVEHLPRKQEGCQFVPRQRTQIFSYKFVFKIKCPSFPVVIPLLISISLHAWKIFWLISVIMSTQTQNWALGPIFFTPCSSTSSSRRTLYWLPLPPHSEIFEAPRPSYSTYIGTWMKEVWWNTYKEIWRNIKEYEGNILEYKVRNDIDCETWEKFRALLATIWKQGAVRWELGVLFHIFLYRDYENFWALLSGLCE